MPRRIHRQRNEELKQKKIEINMNGGLGVFDVWLRSNWESFTLVDQS